MPLAFFPSKIDVPDIDQSESPTPTDRCRGLRFRGCGTAPHAGRILRCVACAIVGYGKIGIRRDFDKTLA
ncbi:MAG: hypothetical protein K2O61_02125 [Bacteroidaceae bacterium]|nr:hypothetical protein [Bacteroidaceae bacterium]